MVRHAYEQVPFYRRSFDRCGVHPADIKGLEDLIRLPIIQKNDFIHAQRQSLIAGNTAAQHLIQYQTGGSTGIPFTFYSTPLMADLRVASIYATLIVNGYRPFQKIAVMQADAPEPTNLNRLGLFRRINIPYQWRVEDQVQYLQQLQAPVIEGYPSRLSQIAHTLCQNGINDIRPNLIITNSETLTDGDREIIERAFGVNPTNVYDSWELGNIGWECPRHEGLHINSDRLIVEIVKDANAPDDEYGEVVVTDLFNSAMPLIRYATGDMAVQSKNPCRCGRSFPLLNQIVGRRSEKLLRSDGSSVMAASPISAIMKNIDGVIAYQAVQDKIGKIKIYIVEDKRYRVHEEAHLQHLLRQNLLLDEVTIKRVAVIKKTPSQKHRSFVSRIAY
jgi:phenylacetate-CoA ligase